MLAFFYAFFSGAANPQNVIRVSDYIECSLKIKSKRSGEI